MTDKMNGDTETIVTNGKTPIPIIVKSVEDSKPYYPEPNFIDNTKLAPPAKANRPLHSKAERGKAKRQVIAAFIANLGTINTGLMFGFSAVAIPQLRKPDSIIQIDESQASWIAALSSAGTPVGCVLSGWLMDRIGRKKTLLITEIPLILGWILITFASTIEQIYVGRVLVGLGSGMVGAPVRVYTSEVTQPHLRGMLSALATVGISLGIFIQYTLGAFLSWQILSAISTIIPAVALILMLLMPETPNYLIARSKREKAMKSLAKLRGSTYDLEREVDHLQEFQQKTQQANKKPTFDDTLKAIMSPSTLKPFAILVIYFGLYQFTGVNTITFYAVDIFQKTGTNWDKNFCTIFLGGFRLLLSVVACIALRRCGRRPLTFISGIGCGISMLCLGTYMYFKYQWDQATPPIPPMYSWIPVLCIFTFTMTCTLGFLVVPWVMIGEIYPQKIRGLIGGFTTCAAHIFVFLVVKTYPMMAYAINEHGTFLLYGAVSLLGTIFFYFFLPETKGKTLQEIEEYFMGHRKSLDKKTVQIVSNFNNNITSAQRPNIGHEKEKLLV